MINLSATALLVIDVQNDFCPGGALAVPEGDHIIPVINRLKPIFATCVLMQDWHPKNHFSFASQHSGKSPYDVIEMPYGSQVLWPDHCVQGTLGAAFHDALARDGRELVLQKGTTRTIDSYSGFFENDRQTRPRFSDGKTLTEALRERGVTRVILTGLAADFCVGWHALDARAEGLDVTVLEDATRAINLPQPGGETTASLMHTRLEAQGVLISSSNAVFE